MAWLLLDLAQPEVDMHASASVQRSVTGCAWSSGSMPTNCSHSRQAFITEPELSSWEDCLRVPNHRSSRALKTGGGM